MTPDHLLAGVRAADEHAGGIRCLRLHDVEPGYFDVLKADVLHICEQGTPSDVSAADHVTNWVLPFGTVMQFSLLNTTGRFDDYSTDHDMFSRAKTFAHEAEYCGLARFIALFPDAVNFRVNVLGPRSGLSPHEEHILTYAPDGSVVAKLRFHLPVLTNAESTIVLDEKVFALEPGVTYFVNHGCIHGAVNHGTRPRVHIVWDMVLTDAAYELMFGEGKAPSPLVRVNRERRLPTALGSQRQGASRRMPATVSEADRAGLRLADPW